MLNVSHTRIARLAIPDVGALFPEIECSSNPVLTTKFSASRIRKSLAKLPLELLYRDLQLMILRCQ